MEPEHRLWLLLICVLGIPFAFILWGVGAYYHVHWFGLIFSMGVLGFATMVGVQISVSYFIDSYRALSGEAIITVILIRNTLLYATSYG